MIGISVLKTYASDAKSLIKHLLQEDLSKRYGNLKNGVNDIKNHRFFNGLDWNRLLYKEIEPPFIPPNPYLIQLVIIRVVNSNVKYTDSYVRASVIKPTEDPFLNW